MRTTLSLTLLLLLAGCPDDEERLSDAAPTTADAAGSGASATQCNYMGTIYEDGAEFTAADGCNACKCNPSGDTPGRWGCSLRLCTPDGGSVDAPADAAPDLRRPNDGPAPDFLRPEHPGGACPLDPPAEGSFCELPPLSGCGYRPICETGTPVNKYCGCNNNRWNCDDGGYCVPPPTTTDAGAPQCNYMGTLYDDGAVFPAADGCNTCKCNPSGNTPGAWGCSLRGCPPDGGRADGG